MTHETFEIEIDVPAPGVKDPKLRAELDELAETLKRWAGPKNFLESSGPEDTVGLQIVRLQVQQCLEGKDIAAFPWMSRTYGKGTLSEGNLRENEVTDADGNLIPEMVLKQEGGRIYGRPERTTPYILRARNGKLVLSEDRNDQLDPNLRELLEIVNADPRLPQFLKSIQSV